MAHSQQYQFVLRTKLKYPEYFFEKKVLEIGSLDINGTVRNFFDNCDYTGVDVGEGPGVDIVAEGQNLDHANDTYDVTISCECFEHNPYWVATFGNMYRMTKSNGLVIMSCATIGRPEHGTTRTTPTCSPLTVGKGWEYYRNLAEQDFREKFNFDKLFSEYSFEVELTHYDLYFVGIKK